VLGNGKTRQTELTCGRKGGSSTSYSRIAEKATRPRSGLQPGVVQRHERRHAGSKE